MDRHPLLIGLGTSLYRAGNPHDGFGVLIQAMEETLAALDAGGDVDTSRLVTAAVAAVDGLDWYPVNDRETTKRLVDVFERALSRLTDPLPRALVLSCLAAAHYHDGDTTRPAGLSDEALALARLTTDHVALAHILHLRATALSGPDHLHQRMHAITELLSLPGLPPLMTARARRLHAHLLVTMGRVAEASADMELAAQLVAGQDTPLRTQRSWYRAGLLLLGGRWREADELRRATYDRHSRTGWGDARFSLMVQRWEAAYLTGDGANLVDELGAAAESSGLPALHAILVMALIEAGRIEDARVALRRVPSGPKDYQWLYTRCWELLAAVRLGETELVTRQRTALLPYRHLTCAIPDLVMSGSVAYFTGEAAMAVADPDAGLVDLTIAADTTRRMGAEPWSARVDGAMARARRLKAA